MTLFLPIKSTPEDANWLAIERYLGNGLSITITTAKLTPGGATGSMTFMNGILIAQTAAT